MPVSALKVPAEVGNLIRQLHPDLKRKIRSALADILKDPTCGKALREALHGYWSLRRTPRAARNQFKIDLAAKRIDTRDFNAHVVARVKLWILWAC